MRGCLPSESSLSFDVSVHPLKLNHASDFMPKLPQTHRLRRRQMFYCGTSRKTQYSPRHVLFKDNGLITGIIIGSCVVLYLGSLLLNPAHVMRLQGGLFNIGSPHQDALYLLGMTGGSAWHKGHIWTLLSASFLHGSLLHILFNLSWFNTLAKMSNALLGPARI